MATRPSKLPRWADVTGLVAEPTEAKKDIGFKAGEKPPNGFFNWLLLTIYLWIVYLDDRITNQATMSASDDFMGSAVSTGLWTSANAITLWTDLTNGKNGVAKLDPTTGGGAGQVGGTEVVIGTVDFYFMAIMRFPNYATALAMDSQAGFFSLVAAEECYFQFDRTIGATAFVKCNVANTNHATSTAVPIGSFAKFEIQRIAGVVTFYINGLSVYSQAFATNITASFPIVQTNTNASSGILYLDKLAYRVELAR